MIANRIQSHSKSFKIKGRKNQLWLDWIHSDEGRSLFTNQHAFLLIFTESKIGEVGNVVATEVILGKFYLFLVHFCIRVLVPWVIRDFILYLLKFLTSE